MFDMPTAVLADDEPNLGRGVASAKLVVGIQLRACQLIIFLFIVIQDGKAALFRAQGKMSHPSLTLVGERRTDADRL